MCSLWAVTLALTWLALWWHAARWLLRLIVVVILRKGMSNRGN